jgi:hypothetical protein
MGYWKRRLLGVGLPCLLALLLDAGLTTLGQSQEYWSGDYAAVNEGNPFFRKLFAIHPGAAIAGYVAWAGVLIGLVLLLPEVLAVVLSIAVVFGHVGGAYTWMQHFEWVDPFGQGWFQTAAGLLPAAAVVLGIGLCWGLAETGRPGTAGAAPSMPGAVRWGLITLLLGVSVYVWCIAR